MCVFAVAAFFFAQATLPLMTHGAPVNDGKVLATAEKHPPRAKKEPVGAYKVIAGRNLFSAKIAPPKPKASAAKPKELPISKSNVRLLGTIYSTDPQVSRAIIFANGKQFLHKIGDKAHGLEFLDIRRRAALVGLGNREELLVIDSKDVRPAKASFRSSKLSRKQALAYLSDIDGLTRDVTVAPRRQGRYQGLSVTRLKRGTLLERAGLRQGDLVLDANGRKFTGPADMMRLTQDIRQGDLSLGVLRGGKPITLNIQLDAQ